MNTKLFFVCPFSQTEALVRYEYGNNAFFATSTGAIPQFEEEEYVKSIISLIRKHSITDIYLVTDTECRFMNSVLTRDKGFGMPCEKDLQRVFDAYLLEILLRDTLELQQKSFAILNIVEQAKRMMANEDFQRCVQELGVSIRGIVTTKSANRLTEFNISNSSLINGLSSFNFQLN